MHIVNFKSNPLLHRFKNRNDILFGGIGIDKAKTSDSLIGISHFPFCWCNEGKAFALVFIGPISIILQETNLFVEIARRKGWVSAPALP